MNQKRVFVVSDIHGQYEAFLKLLEEISYTPGHDRMFVLGDMIDRGPDSASVVQTVMDLGMEALIGNHEVFLVDYIDGALDTETYFTPLFGGYPTLKSYEGRENPEDDFERHLEYIESLPQSIRYENFVFVHEGFPIVDYAAPIVKIFGHTNTNIVRKAYGLPQNGMIFYDEKSRNVCIDGTTKSLPKIACIDLTNKEEIYVYLAGLKTYRRRCPVDWI